MIPGLRIVIVNMNLREDTLGLLNSLMEAGALPEQVIIVDNGSTDNSIPAFHERFQNRLQIIENSSNLHFCAASNQGFQAALDQGAQWVMLLNNDTYVDKSFFLEFEKALLSDSSLALLSPVIFYHSKPTKIWFLGNYVVPGTLIAHNNFHGRQIPPRLPDILPVDFISGCAMLIRRDVFEAIGLFEPSLLIYWDEVDFCWRARQAGFKMACVTGAKMWHKISETMGRQKPQALFLKTRNQVRFYRKHARGLQRPIMYLFAAYKSSLVLGSALLHGETDLIKPVFRGWFSGWNAP